MTFLLMVRVAELEDMSKLAIAWRMSIIYHACFHQAERSFTSRLTALLVLPPAFLGSASLPSGAHLFYSSKLPRALVRAL